MLVALILTSLILGSVPFGLIISLRKGIDPRLTGSGNIGATNVARSVGKWEGLVTLLLDLSKGLLPTYIALKTTNNETFSLISGLLAILGHCFSPFLNFKGGKGVATSLGVILGVKPELAILALMVFAIVFYIKRIVSLSSITATVVTTIFGLFILEHTKSKLIMAIIATIVVLKHKDNIERLIRGTEPTLKL
ncbi:MAG: glycerol-3-phosphate 1-O-acyltransferase PlsY [Thermosulfidibacteraceae bacterium]